MGVVFGLGTGVGLLLCTGPLVAPREVRREKPGERLVTAEAASVVAISN